MKRIFTSYFFLLLFVMTNAQWSPTNFRGKKYREDVNVKHHYSLDISLLRSQLANAQEMGVNSKPVVISLPTTSGKMEKFAVYSFPVVVKELADMYQLGSFVGTGVDDPSKYVRFSLAPNDFQSMIIHGGASEFIEPVNTDKTVYGVFPKSSKAGKGYSFQCSTQESPAARQQMDKLLRSVDKLATSSNVTAKSSDKKYRTLRIAVSTTAEYTNFFGGVSGALTQINATLTRVNGVFEKDLGLHLNLQNYPALIYTNAATDPYDTVTNPLSPPNSWNLALQQTLTNVVGNANYDIGHLFGASGGGGNAGCIGCICSDPASANSLGKGGGITSPATGSVNPSATRPPSGDTFDIDYVAHEIGHQLGAYHTFAYQIQGTPVHMEPGSGSTIMGYAGITGNQTDVQSNSDPYLHVSSIILIEDNLKTKTCDVETSVTNNPPTIAAIPDYTIPKGTAFVLTANATDPENNPMTYTWEQLDQASVVIDRNNLGLTNSGASFRSKMPSTSPTRYFPALNQVLAGVLNNANYTWESVSMVPRTTTYAITVRDNSPAANQQQTTSGAIEVEVHNNGPFVVTTTGVYFNGPSNITWDVVGTNAAPFNVANVKIDYTTNNGNTWTVITASTPNDGQETINIPGLTNGSNIIIRVSAIDNIFYAVKSVPVGPSPACSTGAATGIVFSNITANSAVVTWDASTGATYSIQYRPEGSTTWTTVTSPTNTVTLTGLAEGTVYEVQVANVCSGSVGAYSPIENFITMTVRPCNVQTAGATAGYLSQVSVVATNAGAMTSNSGVPTSTYSDYTTDYSRLVTLVRGSNSNRISFTKAITPSTNTYAVAAWIDYNRNGTFESTERVANLTASSTANVNATFNVPGTAWAGPETVTMRVIMFKTALSTTPSCGVLANTGEVEDYPVRFINLPACSTTTAPLNVMAQNITPSTAVISWWGSTGATYSVQYRPQGSTTWTTVTPTPTNTTNITLTGLIDDTTYEYQVANVCGGTVGVYSTTQTFTTPVLSYCNAASVATTGYISRVIFAPTNSNIVDNTSGPSNYTLFPMPITFVKGSANNKITVYKDWTGTTQTNLATSIWIDYNRNGIFETTERVYNNTTNTTTPLTATISIPATAFTSPTLKTRVRIIVSNTANPDPCGNPAVGEVEDYDVNIIELDPCTTAAPANITISSVTVVGATVSWSATTGATYQLQYRPITGGAWTTVTTMAPGPNVHNIFGLTEGTTYEVQVRTTCGGVTGPWSTSVQFTTPTLSYCNVASTNPNSPYISKVTMVPNGLSEVENASGQNNYTLYTTPQIRLRRGSTGNVIKIDREWFGASTAVRTHAWIDFNRDGVFEAGERIYSNTGTSTANTVQQSFAVPAAGSAGMYMGNLPTRMRVIVRADATPDPCQNFADGEVEDYEVVFLTAPTACSTAAPTNINATNITHNSARITWDNTPTATYEIRYRVSPSGPWQPAAGFVAATGNGYNITGLLENTTYDVQVRSKCSTSTGAWSSTYQFTTKELTYCRAIGSGDSEYIGKLEVDPAGTSLPTITNISGPDNYISYTNDPTKLIELEFGSTTNKIEVTKGWGPNVTNVAVAAWIDLNRNGTFDTNERILNVTANTTNPVSATFAVPAQTSPLVYTGPLNTTMRVVVRKTTAAANCGGFDSGEVEDYAVRLRPCSSATPTGVTVTNITHTTAQVSWTAPTAGTSFVVEYREAGSGVWVQVPATTTTVTLTGLTPAQAYEVRVAGSCADTIGSFTAPVNFATRCDPSPVTVTINNITPYSAEANWNAVGNATYTIEIREVGSTGAYTTLATGLTTNSYIMNNLDPYTTYEVRVATTCNGETTLNPYSNPKVFTTERICEIAPPGLTITNLTATTAVVVWDPFPGVNYKLRYRKVGLQSWTEVIVNTNSYTITGLQEQTKYEMQVANICSGTPGNWTEPYYFTTPIVYLCPMQSATAENYISNVSVTPNPSTLPVMNNASAASTYTDYTGVPELFVSLEQGSTGNRISVTKSLRGNVNVGTAVWIDFNRNGQFELEERILAVGPDANPTAEAVFSVPANAFISMASYAYVTMRVAVAKDGIPANCMPILDGEVEDYTVKISKKGIENTIDQEQILIYPNPVIDILNVKNISKRAKYKIYNAAGQLVGDGIILNNKINLSKLTSGVYVIDINDEIENVSVQKKFIKE